MEQLKVTDTLCWDYAIWYMFECVAIRMAADGTETEGEDDETKADHHQEMEEEDEVGQAMASLQKL